MRELHMAMHIDKAGTQQAFTMLHLYRIYGACCMQCYDGAVCTGFEYGPGREPVLAVMYLVCAEIFQLLCVKNENANL
jgi:hypothetical protein